MEHCNCATPFIITHVSNTLACKKNFALLKDRLTSLKSKRDGVDRYIQTAIRNGNLIKPEVEDWRGKVTQFLNEATELITESEEIDRWFQGWSNFACYQLGQEAPERIIKLTELMSLAQSYDSYTSVSDPAPPRSFVSSGDFVAFSSRDSITKEIITTIIDETVNKISVLGMGGTGKTTLMKEPANVMMENDRQLFDQVAMTIVSQSPDLSRIQDDLASKLGIPDFKPTDTASTSNVRANQLKERLGQNRILVIFDDVWEKLNLEDDFSMDFEGNQKSLKVIFTTRRYDLCTEMQTQKIIRVDVLSEQDSLDLFQQQAGDFGDSHVLNNLARGVVKQCGGLPLAIPLLEGHYETGTNL